VSYTTSFNCAIKHVYIGEMWLRRGAQRLVLMSDEGKIVDVRYLREGEEINSSLEIEFPCNVARISYRLEHTHHPMALMP
jgi:hypothetical protein